MIFGFFLIQACLLFLLILLVPIMIALNMLWVCANVGKFIVTLWLFASVLLAWLIRTFAESSKYSKVEILHLCPVSKPLVFEHCENCPAGPASERVSGPLTTPKSHNLKRLVSFSRHLSAAQWSPHGMVIILRPSKIVNADVFNIKYILSGLFRGFVQICLLVIMTVLFGSTYHTNILLVAVFPVFSYP